MHLTEDILIMNGFMLVLLIVIMFLGISNEKAMEKKTNINEQTKLEKVKELLIWWLVIIAMITFIASIMALSIKDYASKKKEPEPIEEKFIPPANHSWR